MEINEQFNTLKARTIGDGQVSKTDHTYHLTIGGSEREDYHDAQFSDLDDSVLHWKPPLRMTVQASAHWSAGEQPGTAGFGFWNQPFIPGMGLPKLPRALWFFYAPPPNNMALAKDVPGYGWKCATIDATRWPFLVLLPTAPIGLLLMRIRPLYRILWPIGQRAIGVSEHLLDTNLLDSRHTYTLEWRKDSAYFAVDGVVVHETRTSPHRAMGFIAWVDNQYAIVTPQGHFGHGLLTLNGKHTLTLHRVKIEQLED